MRFRATVTASFAASVPIRGRVLTPKGSGIQNATVTLTNQNGESRTARTNPFGYFQFDDIEAGQTYFVNVRAKSWTFEPMTVNVGDESVGLEIVAIDE